MNHKYEKTQAIHRSNNIVKIFVMFISEFLSWPNEHKKFPGRIENPLINAAGVYCSLTQIFSFLSITTLPLSAPRSTDWANGPDTSTGWNSNI